jgi:uncharacterized membrane protein YbjE (DUF340 family)
MLLIIIALVGGYLIGSQLNENLIKLNDHLFTYLSTLFIFLMGISLGINKSTFIEAENLILNSVLLAVTASAGSIITITLIYKFLLKRKCLD